MFESPNDPRGCFSVERRPDRCRVLNISSPPPHFTNELTLTHASFISAKGRLSGCWLGGAINQFSFQMSIMQPQPKLHSSLWTSHGCLRISLKHRCAHLWCAVHKKIYIYITHHRAKTPLLLTLKAILYIFMGDFGLTSADSNWTETCDLIVSKMILLHLEEISKLNTQLFLLMSCTHEIMDVSSSQSVPSRAEAHT